MIFPGGPADPDHRGARHGHTGDRGAHGGASTSPATGGSQGCTATYPPSGQSPGGFLGNVDVTAGSAAIHGWTVTWTFANGQTVSQSWGATITSSGAPVSASNASYNGGLSAAASTSFGVIGSWAGSNIAPVLSCTAA